MRGVERGWRRGEGWEAASLRVCTFVTRACVGNEVEERAKGCVFKTSR